VYLRNLPSASSKPAVFSIGAANDGEVVFTSNGCAGCHGSGAALAGRIRGQTLTEIAAEMWNHAPRMFAANGTAAAGAKFVRLDPGEMRDLLNYLWADQFFEDSGNPAAGRRVFTAKRCSTCHENPASGAPKISGSGRSFTAATMVATLWHHGPRMLDQMKTKGISWPRFDGPEMANLVAYLNAQNAARNGRK
jgi:mono/diheme cytochrome c family protein